VAKKKNNNNSNIHIHNWVQCGMALTAAAVILKQEKLTISSIGIRIIPTLLNCSVAMALTAAAVILKQGKKIAYSVALALTAAAVILKQKTLQEANLDIIVVSAFGSAAQFVALKS